MGCLGCCGRVRSCGRLGVGVGVCSVATPFAAACALSLVPPPSPPSMSDRRFSSLSELLERALSADFRPEAAARLNQAQITTPGLLKALSETEWAELGLSLGSRKALQLALGVTPISQGSPAGISPTPVTTPGMFRFASDPASATAQQAAKSAASAAKAASDMKMRSDGQRGGIQKAKNARTTAHCRAFMHSFLQSSHILQSSPSGR